MNRIEIILGDITELNVDVIVNSADNFLMGESGINEEIHNAAGPKLLEECKFLGGCLTGDAKITRGYELQSKYIIHTVGPNWNDGSYEEADLLKSCYDNSLDLAYVYGLTSIAFPTISAEKEGFPPREAALVALRCIKNYLDTSSTPDKVILVCSDKKMLQIYSEQLALIAA